MDKIRDVKKMSEACPDPLHLVGMPNQAKVNEQVLVTTHNIKYG